MKSVKKMEGQGFRQGVNRKIEKGPELLNIPLETLIEQTSLIKACRKRDRSVPERPREVK